MTKALCKKIPIVQIILIVLLVSTLIAHGTIELEDESDSTRQDLNASFQSTDETVWWNTTEFSTESYTAPFFEVYRLKDFGQCTYGLASADFNNDDLLDIVVGWTTSPNNHTGVSIFYGNNDRSFNIENIKRYYKEIEDLDAVDFDNDGDIDIMCAKDDRCREVYDASVTIFWNEDGSFEREEIVAIFYESEGYWINVHVATADFDMDGDVDFIAGANCGKVVLFKNDGFGHFSSEGYICDYGYVSWGLATGDFNGDGYPDFVVSADTNPEEGNFSDVGHIYLKLNDGSPDCFDHSPGVLVASLPLKSDYTIGAASFGSVEVLDYNDDGLLDIIYGGDWKIFLFIQQRNGIFQPFYACGLRDRELTWVDHLHEGGFTIGDFNDDGLNDIVVGGVQGTVRLLINNQTCVMIVKPVDRLLYVFGRDDWSLKFPGRKVVVGAIDVTAEGLEPLSRVDFYLDDKLVCSDDVEPFVWNWTGFSFGKYTVATVAYDMDGKEAGCDKAVIWKFL